MSTPVNPTQPKGLKKDKRTAWVKALDSLDKSRPVAFGHHYATDAMGNEIGEPAVWLERGHEPQYHGVVWSKQYRAREDGLNLSAFTTRERDMLKKLKGTAHCYHLEDSHGVDRNDSSILKRSGKTQFDQTKALLKTSDKGTGVSQWLTWPVYVGKVRHDHVFRLAGHYLRFARSALIALNELHDRLVVHCDLNPGNWCLESKFDLLTDGQDRLRLSPDWAEVSIIDVGYSLHLSVQPQTQMPFDRDRISRYLKTPFDAVQAAGKKAFASLKEKTKTDKGWREYKDDAEFSPEFWSTHAPLALRAYEQVDWREDYWRLGKLLYQMRGGRRWKEANGTIRVESLPYSTEKTVVNQLIGEPSVQIGDTQSATTAYGLAEDFLAWGDKNTSYDTLTDQNSRIEQSEALRRQTSEAFMQLLNYAIAQLTPEDDAKYVFLMREDLDPGYLQRLEDQKKRQALWRARAQTAARGTIAAAGLAGAVTTATYGYDNWLKPALTHWQQEQKDKQLAEERKREAAAAEADRLAREATAQAQAATQRIKAAQQAVQKTDFGGDPWRKAIAEMATLCQPPQQPEGAVAANTTACTAAFTQVQQDYLRASPQAQNDLWWSEGHFNTQPPATTRNWLFATRTLAGQGLWVAQVNQALSNTVGAARTVPELAPSREDRVAAARTLVALITPQQLPASAYAVAVPPEVARPLRSEAAETLLNLRRDAESKISMEVSKQILPDELVLPVVHAVADTPSKALQAKLAYSLICWTNKPDETQALAYFAKAEVAQDGNDQAIANQAKAMRLAHQNGGLLCKK